MGLDRFDGLGDAHAQNATRMEGLPHHGIVEAQISCYRVHLPLWPCVDALNRVLDLVKQGQHITGIARIAWGHEVGEDKTGRGFRDDAGLSAKLRWAIALAFDNRGNGGIIGIDKFAVAELLALGQLGGLFPDVGMVAHRAW